MLPKLPIATPCRFASVAVDDRIDIGARWIKAEGVIKPVECLSDLLREFLAIVPRADLGPPWIKFDGATRPVEGLADLLPAFLALGAERHPPVDSFLRFVQRFGPLGLDEEGFPAGRRSRWRWGEFERVDHIRRAARVAAALLRMAGAIAKGDRVNQKDYRLCVDFFREVRQGMSPYLKDRLELLPAVRFPAWKAEKARRTDLGHQFTTVKGAEEESAYVDPMQSGFLAGALAWWIAAAGATIRVNMPWHGTPAAFALKEVEPFKEPRKGFETIDLERQRLPPVSVSVEEGAPLVDVAATGLWLPLGVLLSLQVQEVLAGRDPGSPRWEVCGFCGEPYSVGPRGKRRIKTKKGCTPCCGSSECKKAQGAARQLRHRRRRKA